MGCLRVKACRGKVILMNEALALRVFVKPVFAQLIHSAAYEGPCRVGDKETLSPETERREGKKHFVQFYRELEKSISPEAVLLKPTYIEWRDDWAIPEEEMRKLEPDIERADLVLIAPSGLAQYPAIRIAERYRKPVAMVGQVISVDMSAYLRSRGMEGYALLDLDELNYLISLLRVKKAIMNTRILIVTAGSLLPVGVVSSIWDLEAIKRRYGIDYKCITADEVFEEMDRVMKDDQRGREAEKIADDLIKKAEKVHMSYEDILRSVYFYVAVKSLMTKYRCNAFTIPCFEICARRIASKRKVTFCLTHTLLKDEGYPSACEGDVSVLLAMMLLMYISRKSAYMGNSYVVDREKSIVALHHDVPGLKMKGLEGEELPYEIRNFTMEGWGATIRYDFSRDRGEIVTLARFDPTGTRLLVTKGEIVGCEGFDEVGCRLRALIKVPDAVRLFHKEEEFGHHLAMVYGDYIRELKDLGKLMGFKVVEV